MSQRPSGYERKDNDLYETPDWATRALMPHLRPMSRGVVLEPSAGSGKMSSVLREQYCVTATDISEGIDFLSHSYDDLIIDAVITNPPYGLAQQFIERALALTQQTEGLVAMLLRTDYDHAKTRQRLFAACPQFAKKVVLTKRVVWFERPGAAPSFNHAWFIWDHANTQPPTLGYDIQ